MVNKVDIVDQFAQDGEAVFDFDAKDRADQALPNPATATGSFVVTDWRTNTIMFQCTDSPEFLLTDAGTSTFQVKPSAAKLALIEAGVTYRYDVWTVTPQEGRLHQLQGLFRLYPSSKET